MSECSSRRQCEWFVHLKRRDCSIVVMQRAQGFIALGWRGRWFLCASGCCALSGGLMYNSSTDSLEAWWINLTKRAKGHAHDPLSELNERCIPQSDTLTHFCAFLSVCVLPPKNWKIVILILTWLFVLCTSFGRHHQMQLSRNRFADDTWWYMKVNSPNFNFIQVRCQKLT